MQVFRVSPTVLDARGGQLLHIVGDFPASAPLQVRLQYGGQSVLAYGGIAGQGTRLTIYGNAFDVTSPAAPSGASFPMSISLRVEMADDPAQFADSPSALSFNRPTYASQTFALRGLFPPIDATGPRDLQAVQSEGPLLPGAVLPHVLDALGEAFTEFGGTRSSFVTFPASKGATSLTVDSTTGMVSGGHILLGQAIYTFDSFTHDTYVGLRAEDGPRVGLLQDVAAGDEVVDVTSKSRLLGRLHESYFLGSADGPDLSVCGRNYGLTRDPSIRDDATYAAACLAIAYGPRGTLQGLRMALDAMVGPGNYSLREDTLNYPCRVFVDLPQSLTLGQTATGRTYLSGPRPVAATDAQTLTLPSPVYGLNRVVRPSLEDTQDTQGVRPSPPWTYTGTNELADVSVHPDAPGLGCVRFEPAASIYRVPRDASDAADTTVSMTLRMTPGTPSTPDIGTGIAFGVQSANRLAAVGIYTNGAGALKLAPCDALGAISGTRFLTVQTGNFVEVSLHPLPSGAWELTAGGQHLKFSGLSYTATPTGAFVGRLAAAGAGAPTIDIGSLRLSVQPSRNFAQAMGSSAQVQSGSGQQVVLDEPLVARMTPGQSIRIQGSQVTIQAPGFSSGPAGSNDGDYQVVSIDSPVTATVRRFVRTDGVLGSSATAINQLDLPKPVFSYPQDLGRQVVIDGTGNNAGTYVVAQLVDALGQVCTLPYPRSCPSVRLVRPDGSVPDFNSQTKVAFDLRPSFVSESSLRWVIDQAFDLVENGSDVRADFWQPLPDGSATYDVTYNDHLGGTLIDGQSPVVVLQKEGPPPVFNFYPAYIASPLSYVGNYLSELCAAGVRAVVNIV